MSRRGPTSPRRRGFSLLEMLVALAIGAVLLAGFVQIYAGSKQTYRVQQEMSRLQENARAATEVVSRIVRLVGYRSNHNAYLLEGAEIFGGEAALYVDAAPDSDSDVLTVRFQSFGDMRDCLAQPVAVDQVVVNVLTVRNGTLACANKAAPSDDDWVALVDGVSRLQVLLGEDTDGDQVANRYVSTAGGADVVGVRVLLTLENPSAAALEPVPQVVATIALRNRITGGPAG